MQTGTESVQSQPLSLTRGISLVIRQHMSTCEFAATLSRLTAEDKRHLVAAHTSRRISVLVTKWSFDRNLLDESSQEILENPSIGPSHLLSILILVKWKCSLHPFPSLLLEFTSKTLMVFAI